MPADLIYFRSKLVHFLVFKDENYSSDRCESGDVEAALFRNQFIKRYVFI